MQLFTRVLLLSVAVIGANAWPRTGDDQSLLRMVMAEVSSHSMIEDRAMSPAENACYVAYNNATNQVANQLSNATNKCEEAANRTMLTNYQSTNSSVNLIRSQLLQLEQNLQRCRNETDSARLINCTVSHFDANLKLLDTSNSQAYQVKSQIAANSSNISLQRTSCVSAAISECKVKNIEAANAYDSCLSLIPYQRDLIVHEETAPGTAQATAQGTAQGTAPGTAPGTVQETAPAAV
ncbi:uncharacterized protein LOC117785396 isoform X2 [Drosophila innubila]|uniref:uncharacterized protein LOC117785396 isoform X2 n=1 Tax=Drosophila innubila TaxID=198719 RepID=UPI00148E8E15|nr:uncharacterized protein LOC117785396 isoform X2 [Drosophila innubila]